MQEELISSVCGETAPTERATVQRQTHSCIGICPRKVGVLLTGWQSWPLPYLLDCQLLSSLKQVILLRKLAPLIRMSHREEAIVFSVGVAMAGAANRVFPLRRFISEICPTRLLMLTTTFGLGNHAACPTKLLLLVTTSRIGDRCRRCMLAVSFSALT